MAMFSELKGQNLIKVQTCVFSLFKMMMREVSGERPGILRCVEDDLTTLGLGRNDHLDCDGWKVKIRSQTAAKPSLVSLPLGNAREG